MTSPSRAFLTRARAEAPVASVANRARMYAAPSRVARAVTTSARASREPTNARSVTRHRRRAASNAGRSDAGERAREGERDLNGAVLRNFAFPALAGALFGWDIGISSGALENVATSAANGGDGFALSSIESGQFVSASLFGALTASAAAGAGLGDRLGSRKELALAGAAYWSEASPRASPPGSSSWSSGN